MRVRLVDTSFVLGLLLATFACVTADVSRAAEGTNDAPKVRGFVLKLRERAESPGAPSADEYIGQASAKLGLTLRKKGVGRLGAVKVESAAPLTLTETKDLLAQWVRDPALLWVEQEFDDPWKDGPPPGVADVQIGYLVVKSHDPEPKRAAKEGRAPNRDFEVQLSAIAQHPLRHHMAISGEAHVYRLSETMPYRRAWALAKRIEESGLVEFAEVSALDRELAVPNDPSYTQQWHYQVPSVGNPGGANLPPAWDISQGSPSLVVAVIDSGISSSHPDFASKLVPGYDFISSTTNGDGSGRDSDPTDPGMSCGGKPPSWHGTHVAGTIGAGTNNGIGVAGVAPNVKVQALRVMNVCGSGDTFDIADAIRWAAGGTVPGVPANTTPAKVINLSLGGPGPCPTIYQQAIDFALGQGAIVIAAAGNDEGVDVAQIRPANCPGVIRVAAHGRWGDRASYTNLGINLPISISAPGGQKEIDGGIYSTVGPSTYGFQDGTSMAAPHVSGVAALIRSQFPAYTVNDVAGVFLSSAREFAPTTFCYATGYCGPGLLDAYNAVTDRTNLTILFEGSGTVTSAPAGISCTNDCGYYVPYSPNPAYTLTASPAPGYVFLGWALACGGTSTCSYTPNRSKTVGARFALAGSVFSLSVTKTGTGTGLVASSPAGVNCGSACSYNYGSGATVTLAATASPDSVFSGWSGACSGTSSTCTVSMTAARSVGAAFTSLDDYPDVAASAVAILPNSSTSASLYSGTDEDWFKVTFPVKGRWAIGTLGTTDTVGSVYASDGVTLYGTNDDANGSVNFELLFTIPAPQTLLLKVAGYRDLAVQTTGPYTLQSLFVPTFALTVAKSGAGSGAITSSPAGIDCGATCSVEFTAGSSVSLSATPASGSTFAGWSGACTGTGSCTVSMNGDQSVTATFVPATTGALSASPPSLAFGGQSMNTTSPAMTTTLTNGSTNPITVTGVSASTGYAVSSNTCATVPAGGSCTVGVTFTPPVATTTGGVNGTLTVNYTGGPTTVALSGTAERSLVTHYYRSTLRRAPDSGGKTFWSNEATRVGNLGANVNEVWYAMAMQFYTSPEYAAFMRDNTGFVTDLYNTFFNRGPDSGGLSFWLNNLNSGMPREVALAEFMFSNEFRTFSRAIFGNPAVRAELDMVMDFYRGLLARTPDDGGFNFWVGRFRAAQCQGAAAVTSEVEAISSAFALSGEYAARGRNNAQYVGDLYNAFLRRGGDLNGVLFWISTLTRTNPAPLTREQLRVEFKNSPEFQARVQAIIQQGCFQ